MENTFMGCFFLEVKGDDLWPNPERLRTSVTQVTQTGTGLEYESKFSGPWFSAFSTSLISFLRKPLELVELKKSTETFIWLYTWDRISQVQRRRASIARSPSLLGSGQNCYFRMGIRNRVIRRRHCVLLGRGWDGRDKFSSWGKPTESGCVCLTTKQTFTTNT